MCLSAPQPLVIAGGFQCFCKVSSGLVLQQCFVFAELVIRNETVKNQYPFFSTDFDAFQDHIGSLLRSAQLDEECDLP